MATISEALALAVRHLQAGRLQAAEQIYRQILAVDPDHTDALNMLGVVASRQDRLDEAVECIGRAIALKGTEAAFHSNLGAVLKDQGKLDEAVASCQRALELKSDYAPAHYNLGNAKLAQGKLDDAIRCYRRAIELKLDLFEVHSNLATALMEQGKIDEAVASYRRALQIKPDDAVVLNNLGSAQKDQGKLDEAVDSFHRALELKPDYAEMHSNLGNALQVQGDYLGAVACYRRAIELKPELLAAHDNLLYMLWFCPDVELETIYEEHCRWNQRWAEPSARTIAPHANDASPNRRIRIGYVSPNFCTHAEAYFLVPLLASHNHQDFEIFCYSDVVSPDHITAKMRSHSDAWRTTYGVRDEDVAELVRSDKIDILVDLTLHMAQARPLLFARKPAPVQACWLAYQGTTGLTTMDYRLTDPHLDPPGLFDRTYSEESVRLRDSFWCYDPLTDGQPAVNALPALTNGYVTFGCLNNFCKVNAGVLKLWARVLTAVERSRLLLLAPEGSARRNVLQVLNAEGISADRVTFVPRQRRLSYFETYHQIDIGLDTLPYNGQTTTLDAAWMGVPVVTLVGQTAVGRAGLSMLHNLGLPELSADKPQQFVEISARLASDLPRLGQLRASLREMLRASPLMDAPRFARSMEAAYRSMWQRWCAGRTA